MELCATSGDPAFEGWRRSLREVVDLRDLARSLSFARGFVTYLLVCESRSALDAALEALSEALTSTGAPEWVRYSSHDEAPREETLVDEILSPLADERPVRSRKVVAVIDATVGEDGAWEGFFTRLNRARNLVMRNWRAPVIVALPERLLTPFARSAPDVRSGVTRIARVPAPPLPIGPGAKRLFDELPTLLEPNEMVSLLPEIQPTRFDGVGGTAYASACAG